jgi:ribokinase
MANREEPDTSEAVVVALALQKLRMRGGLVASRLRDAGDGSLLRLPSVLAHAARHEVEPPEAALQVISKAIRELANGTHRIVADSVLGAGLLADAYVEHGFDDRVVRSLRATSLMQRRTTLLANWRQLHLAIGISAPVAPSDRTLRGTIEPEVFRQLARRLILPDPLDADEPDEQPFPVPRARPAGRVIVVGGAVFDFVWRTNVIPQHETSTLADDCLLLPGGKGVSQAVAAARLGLKVSLVAALGDDWFGQTIVDHLRDENVDTSLLKIVPGARTPLTGVMELSLGDSIAAVWRNKGAISLGIRDIELLSRQITDADAVLATFEVPLETLHRTLELARSGTGHQPTVIVTPGQPYRNDRLSRQHLGMIDFLVGHTWELKRYLPPDTTRFDPGRLAEHLLDRGLGTLCLLENGSGLVYSQTVPELRRLPTTSSFSKVSAITRDAFCAALAAKLIDDGQFSVAVAAWATAAMECAAEDYTESSMMPDRDRIERKLRNPG